MTILKSIHDLDQKIQHCWQVIDDIKLLYDRLDEFEDEDDLANYILGLKTIYQHKFEVLYSTYENSLREGFNLEDAYNELLPMLSVVNNDD